MAGSDPEYHHPALQIIARGGPAYTDQAEKREARGISSHGVEPSASGHADGGFHENGRRSGHAHNAARLAQNCARAQKTNALDNVGSDSRASRIAKAVCDFAR